ncbi:unnamed protein product [Paramecium octaurelia]|uniref:Uncharacterized protein n=1 Tax=Paramecium octaurelia TaxID=43137 RepID=A0A8S1WSS3_PAROT|nr:unnamed protein product [Paramecium octaurelia]
MDNSNFKDQQQEILTNEALSQYQYKSKKVSWKESSTQNNAPKKNNQLNEQTQIESQGKPQSQSQNQENDTEQFYPSLKVNINSFENQQKQENQSQHNQTNDQKQHLTHSQARKNSQLKIQPAFNVNIQITRIYHKKSQSQIPASRQYYRIQQEKNELRPTQQSQSNLIQSQSSEIINMCVGNPAIKSEVRGTQPQESFEIRLKVSEDPDIQQKQKILLEIHDILKQIKIISNCKKHSILEDALQLCLIYLPQIRGYGHSMISQQFYEKAQQIYQIERNKQGFCRRFYHLLIFSDCWTLQNITMLHEIIMKHQQIPLETYHISYDIVKKTFAFPKSISSRQMPEKPKVIQQIIQNEQNKRIVLSLTTKTLFQYVNLPAKEIDEDIEEFGDELQFIDMILKLIPLAF